MIVDNDFHRIIYVDIYILDSPDRFDSLFIDIDLSDDFIGPEYYFKDAVMWSKFIVTFCK